MKLELLMVFFLVIMTGLGAVMAGLILHEAMHWWGTEEPFKMCFGTENDSSATVYYYGDTYWFGTEGVAYTSQFVLTAVLLVASLMAILIVVGSRKRRLKPDQEVL